MNKTGFSYKTSASNPAKEHLSKGAMQYFSMHNLTVKTDANSLLMPNTTADLPNVGTIDYCQEEDG